VSRIIPALAGLLLLLTVARPATAQVSAYEYLQDERASLFDLGIFYLETRFFQIALSQAQRFKSPMSVQIMPNRANESIKIVIDVKRTEDALVSQCDAIRTRFVDAFIGEFTNPDRSKAIAEALDGAFLHRGVITQVSPSYVGVRLAETTTVTVTVGSTSCGGLITE